MNRQAHEVGIWFLVAFTLGCLALFIMVIMSSGCATAPHRVKVITASGKIKVYDFQVPDGGSLVCDASGCRELGR